MTKILLCIYNVTFVLSGLSCRSSCPTMSGEVYKLWISLLCVLVFSETSTITYSTPHRRFPEHCQNPTCEYYSKSAHLSLPLLGHSAIRDIVPVSDNFVSTVVFGMHVAELAETSLSVRACTDQFVHLWSFITHATFRPPYPSVRLPPSVCRSPNASATITHDNCFYFAVLCLWMMNMGTDWIVSPSGLARAYEQVQSSSNYILCP
jgi:hypothetical protein